MSQSENNYEILVSLLRSRHSVRRYKSGEVPSEEEIKKMVYAASLAPSPSNSRNRRFIAVISRETKTLMRKVVDEKISRVVSQINSVRAREEFLKYSAFYTFFDKAPLVISVVMKPYDSLARRIIKMYKIPDIPASSAGIQGVAAAIENLLLAVVSLGWGACWMTGPLIARYELEKILNIEPPEELAAVVPVGKPMSGAEKSVSFMMRSSQHFADECSEIALPDGILEFIR